jgi:molybdate transport system substrate-binding protein
MSDTKFLFDVFNRPRLRIRRFLMFQKFLLMAVISLTATVSCHAKDLVVWSAGAVKPALEVLLPAFQKSSAISIDVQYAPVGVLMRRLAEGGQPDVLVLSTDVVKDVESKGWGLVGSATPLGSVGVGVAVKQGMPLPDISTPDALRKTLLAAKSVTYMDPQKGTSGKHFAGVIDQLGIAEQMKSKTTLGDVGYVLEPVARGEIEVGIQQITEILPVKGAVLVGPLPASLQKITTYAILQGAKANDTQAVGELRKFLQTSEAVKVFEEKGFK